MGKTYRKGRILESFSIDYDDVKIRKKGVPPSRAHIENGYKRRGKYKEADPLLQAEEEENYLFDVIDEIAEEFGNE